MNRDKIALKAMKALIQDPKYRDAPKKLAQHAYKIAEAMVTESKNQSNK